MLITYRAVMFVGYLQLTACGIELSHLSMLRSAATFLVLDHTAVLKCVYNPNEPNRL